MRLLAIIEYDGTDFEGFQVQARKRTVQGELERALHHITGEKIRVIGAGERTPACTRPGKARISIRFGIVRQKFYSARLNAVLPNDIAVRILVQVSNDFSAR